MKFNKLIIFILYIFILSGCHQNKFIDTSDKILTIKSDSENSINDSYLQISEPIDIEPIDTEPIDTEPIKKYFFLETEESFGKLTIQKPIEPWTEEDVNTAWNMLEFSNDYKRYFDCIFIDLNYDGIDELVLTACEIAVTLFVFEMNDNEIILTQEPKWDKQCYDADIGKGWVCTPIVSNEILSKLMGEFFLIDVGILERDFKIIKTTSGDFYITGYVHKSYASDFAGNNFWIKKVNYENGLISFNTLYRWGIFEVLFPNGFKEEIHYYKCNGEEFKDYIEVDEKEVEDFINFIYDNEIT